MAFKYDSINHAQQDALDVYNRYKLAGEDIANDVLRVSSVPIVSASLSPTVFTGYGAATKALVKASPASLVSLYASNVNAAVRYLQVHNKATAPAGTDVPVLSFPIPAGSATVPASVLLDSDFFEGGYYLSTGLGWAISTTVATFTDSATASEHVVNGMYV